MPVDLHGVAYYTVAERLKVAHGDDPPPVGIQSIATITEQHGNVIVVHARVQFKDGRTFDGMSMVNQDSRQPAERDAPLEVAETSAVGRALAFAGYPGNEKGIAGYEEMELAQARSRSREARDPQHGSPAFPSGDSRPRPAGPQQPGGGPATPAQGRFLRQLWERAGRDGPAPDADNMNRQMASRLIDDLVKEAEAKGR
jgi:hypothetical protein